MKLGIIITRTEPETVFNVLKLAQFSLDRGDTVTIFLSGAGVNIDEINSFAFPIPEKLKTIIDSGGKLLSCWTCLEQRGASLDDADKSMCRFASVKDYYDVVAGSDRLVTV